MKIKKIDIGQLITICANLGVIAGILLLAFELSQNNDFLAAQARYNLRVQRADSIDTVISPHVVDAIFSFNTGTDFTPQEEQIAFLSANKIVELWEWQYGEYIAGMLDREQLPIANWVLLYHRESLAAIPIRYFWESGIWGYSDEFVQFIEENVVNADD